MLRLATLRRMLPAVLMAIAAFTLLTLGVLAARTWLAARYHPQQYKADGNGWWFEFLKGPWGNELGEDISFCLKASRMGFGIFVDTAVCPMHMGDYNYEISDYLDYQEQVLAAGGLEEYRRQSRVIEQEKVISRVRGQQTHEQQVEADSVQVLDLAGVGVR